MAVSRKIDELGRITIPKVIRQTLGLAAGTRLNIREEGGTIVLEKDFCACALCGELTNLTEFNSVKICQQCIEKIKEV